MVSLAKRRFRKADNSKSNIVSIEDKPSKRIMNNNRVAIEDEKSLSHKLVIHNKDNKLKTNHFVRMKLNDQGLSKHLPEAMEEEREETEDYSFGTINYKRQQRNEVFDIAYEYVKHQSEKFYPPKFDIISDNYYVMDQKDRSSTKNFEIKDDENKLNEQQIVREENKSDKDISKKFAGVSRLGRKINWTMKEQRKQDHDNIKRSDFSFNIESSVPARSDHCVIFTDRSNTRLALPETSGILRQNNQLLTSENQADLRSRNPKFIFSKQINVLNKPNFEPNKHYKSLMSGSQSLSYLLGRKNYNKGELILQIDSELKENSDLSSIKEAESFSSFTSSKDILGHLEESGESTGLSPLYKETINPLLLFRRKSSALQIDVDPDSPTFNGKRSPVRFSQITPAFGKQINSHSQFDLDLNNIK